MEQMDWTTGQIAKRTGLTVRALRYYDRIGLLKPSRLHGSTRLYSEGDIARLQKLSVLKYIGLTLEEMRAVMESEDENTDLRGSLFLQSQLVRRKMRHMESVIQAIETSIAYIDQQDEESGWEDLSEIIHTVRMEQDWSEQYHNAARLQARTRLYDRFSTNLEDWHSWFFRHALTAAADFPAEIPCRILDIGCGDAALWIRNLERIPAHWEITLADASAGMLEDARSQLGATASRFRFRRADVQALPFAEGEFQIIIANHMLYHVEDLAKAFTGISRVLGHGGIFFASTMSSLHLQEMEELTQDYDASLRVLDNTIEKFNLYNGAELLRPWFPDAKLVRYQDSLVVTDSGPLISYITSTAMNAGIRLTGTALEEFTAFVEHKIAEKQGRLVISKDMGFFTSHREG